MKKAAWMLVVLALAGCGEKPAGGGDGQSANAAPIAEVVAPQPAVHNYAMADGDEYGYERGVSQADAESGKMANSLMMFRYAGQHEGKHQVYVKDGQTFVVLECGNPCDFIKIMNFAGTEFVNKELIRATEGTVGWSVMADAINGFLKVHKTRDGKSHPWFDEKTGLGFVPLSEAKAQKSESPI